MKKVQIRKATIKDFDAIFLLLKQLWVDKELHANDMKRVYARAIDSNSDEYFCTEVDGRIIGFCSLTIKNSLWQEGYIAHVNEIVVDSTYRGQGIGSDLLQIAIDNAREKSCVRVELDSAFQREEVPCPHKGCHFLS